MNEIKVKVTRHGERKYFTMYYDCPMSGKRVQRSTKVEVELNAKGEVKKKSFDEATRVAAKWEQDLQSGRYVASTNITWEEFRLRYELEVASGLADKTAAIIATVFNAVEETLRINRLGELTADRISYFQSAMREGHKSEATIAAYLRHLKAALRWAQGMGMIAKLPAIKMPARARGGGAMKGRPITTEEFERMLAYVEPALAAPRKGRKRKPSEKELEERREAARIVAPGWEMLLRGLWASGLRLNEAVTLSWDDPERIRVDLTGGRPMLVIPADQEKGNQDRTLPITPEFAELLESIPQDDRTGAVFPLRSMKDHDRFVSDSIWISAVISRIGEAANVKVSEKGGKVKFASAHDLRRAFGLRWSQRVMPAVLQQLMRHEDIQTTMKYYVGQDAAAMAEVIWATEATRGGREDSHVDR